MGIIRIHCKRDGTAEVRTEGFSGEECIRAAAPYKAAMGVPIEGTMEVSDEFYETESNDLKNTEDA